MERTKREIYYNGIIYTSDKNRETATAFIVEDGRFVFVGNDEDVKDEPVKKDLRGRCVIPGLVDSHCHLFAGVTQAGTDMQFIDPETAPEELGSVLKEMAAGAESGGTFAAMGIDLTVGEFNASHIDCVIDNRPVIIFSNDGHGLLLNSSALKKLKIDRTTPDPSPDSYYVRDGEGNPTGLVIEIPAMRPCKALLKEPGLEDYIEILPQVIAGYTALGYTTVFEAMSAYEDDRDLFRALNRLDGDGGLNIRISASFGYNGEEFIPAEKVTEIIKTYGRDYSSANVICDTLKIVSDGTVEEHSALLYEPFSDDSENFGLATVSPEDMKKAASLAAKEGFNIHIHAIGDKAVTRAIDVLSGAGKMKGTKTIAHNQLYRDEDIDRMIKAKDIFFQTTPHWMKGDEATLRFLGEERFKHQFPVGSMQRGGVTVSFGSDSCLEEETADAFMGMYIACTRGDEAVWKEANLPPEDERLTRMESLYAYTINGAAQLGIENETGSITPGKSADFAVVDRDIMNCPMEDLKEAEVIDTYFRGIKLTGDKDYSSF